MMTTTKLKIFLVDDEIFYLNILEQHIRNLGYEDISTFDNGYACLDNIQEIPDVVFLDYSMGELSGYDVLKKIKIRYRDLFVKGFITSILNPKDLLFYTAFIPAFIPQDIGLGSYRNYFLVLGFTYMAIGFLTKSSFAVFAGFTKNVLFSDKSSLVNRVSSIVLVCLGVFIVGKSVAQLLS